MPRALLCFVALGAIVWSVGRAGAQTAPVTPDGPFSLDGAVAVAPVVEAAAGAAYTALTEVAEARITLAGQPETLLEADRRSGKARAALVAGAVNVSIAMQAVDEQRAREAAILAAMSPDERARAEREAREEADRKAVARFVASTTWVCPVAGEMQFRDSWGEPRSGGRSHDGIDIVARWGTPLVAPVDGEVTFRSDSIGGLSYDLVGEDGDVWFGTHLSATETGGTVEAGTVIGYVGRSGNAVGNHLHFEYRPGGRGLSVNPFPIVEAHCVQ